MTKHRLAYETLREAILDGLLPPGTRLVLHDIAARLGVSPIPLREALRLLERDGLIEVQPHTKVVVKEFPFEEALWAAEMRLLLEPAAARDAVPNFTSRHLTATRLAFEELRAHGSGGVSHAYLESYGAFYDSIFVATPNQRLVRSLMELRAVARHFRSVYLGDDIVQGAEADLALVLGALAAGDADGVYVAVRLHRSKCLAQLQGLAGERPEGVSPTASAGASRNRTALMNVW